MVSCSAFPLTTPIIWVAILLYDYCLTFVAEVESCWVVRRLSWGLGFYSGLPVTRDLGHVPIGESCTATAPPLPRVCLSFPLVVSRAPLPAPPRSQPSSQGWVTIFSRVPELPPSPPSAAPPPAPPAPPPLLMEESVEEQAVPWQISSPS